jgi:hypothetical protein
MDWDNLKRQLDNSVYMVKELNRRKNLMSIEYNKMLKQSKILKLTLDDIKQKANIERNKLITLRDKLKARKQAWIEEGEDEDSFILDFEGQEIVRQFEESKDKIKEVTIAAPRKAAQEYSDHKSALKALGLEIRKLCNEIRLTEKHISALQVENQVLDHCFLDGTSVYEEYIEIQVVQLSIKKQKKYYNHKRYFSKKKGKWYKLRDYDDAEVVSDELQFEIEELKSKYYKEMKDKNEVNT